MTRRGNPADSPWYSTPPAARKRRPIELTLSEEARTALDALAENEAISRSAVVDRLVLSASKKK